jgi:hypothetical protein
MADVDVVCCVGEVAAGRVEAAMISAVVDTGCPSVVVGDRLVVARRVVVVESEVLTAIDVETVTDRNELLNGWSEGGVTVVASEVTSSGLNATTSVTPTSNTSAATKSIREAASVVVGAGVFAAGPNSDGWRQDRVDGSGSPIRSGSVGSLGCGRDHSSSSPAPRSTSVDGTR